MSSIVKGIAEDMKSGIEKIRTYVSKADKKKLFLQNMPYFFIAWLCNKVSWQIRASPGKNVFEQLASFMNGMERMFVNPLPSLYYRDVLMGILGGVFFRLVVYYRTKNAKKFRHGVEYGSARWGSEKDMEPYMDPIFENNVLLTQTERLMMSGRPKKPKYARNKNILVIGGSGSGKTRFFVKPNLMQMHSSYVVTDPKGYILVGQL